MVVDPVHVPEHTGDRAEGDTNRLVVGNGRADILGAIEEDGGEGTSKANGGEGTPKANGGDAVIAEDKGEAIVKQEEGKVVTKVDGKEEDEDLIG